MRDSPVELVRYPRSVFGALLVDGETFGPRRVKQKSDVRDVERLACKHTTRQR